MSVCCVLRSVRVYISISTSTSMLCYAISILGEAGLGWAGYVSLSLSPSTPTSVRQIVLLPGTVIFNFTVFGLGWGAFLSMLCE